MNWDNDGKQSKEHNDDINQRARDNNTDGSWGRKEGNEIDKGIC